MANALPEYHSPVSPFSRQIPSVMAPGPTPPNMIYQFPGQPLGETTNFGAVPYQNYSAMYQGHQSYPQILPSPQQQQQQQQQAASLPSLINQPVFRLHPQQLYSSQFAQQLQAVPSSQSRAPLYQQPFVRQGSGSYGQGHLQQDQNFRNPGGAFTAPDPGAGEGYLQPVPTSGISSQSSRASSTGPSIPRGPPRKPKQSGHALWVGNLPLGTNVHDLKEHFSKDATQDIESVFLISKSNCAFVNYRTETACAAAMTRFHDSRFQGVRLVCRLRRSSANPASPTPTALSEPNTIPTGELAEAKGEGEQNLSVPVEGETEVSSTGKAGGVGPRSKESYFIVKSLTVDDLEMSVRNGVWATQSHNEAALNRAYENSDNVFLIFSANKSGEYFGYARMASAINGDLASDFDWVPKTISSQKEPEAPSTTPTPATEMAPKGRIIDDSARGTIFWEADPPEPQEAVGEDTKSEKSVEEGEDVMEDEPFGKPFRVEWMSTERLPFFRTRGLRNPWNANREVKIARDGQPVEESAGRRLIQMFHRGFPHSGRPTPTGHMAPSLQRSFQ